MEHEAGFTVQKNEIPILLCWKAHQEHYYAFFFSHCSLTSKKKRAFCACMLLTTRHTFIYIYPYLPALLSRGSSRTGRSAFSCPSLHFITSDCVGAGESSQVGGEETSWGDLHSSSTSLSVHPADHPAGAAEVTILGLRELSGWEHLMMTYCGGVKDPCLPSIMLCSYQHKGQ